MKTVERNFGFHHDHASHGKKHWVYFLANPDCEMEKVDCGAYESNLGSLLSYANQVIYQGDLYMAEIPDEEVLRAPTNLPNVIDELAKFGYLQTRIAIYHAFSAESTKSQAEIGYLLREDSDGVLQFYGDLGDRQEYHEMGRSLFYFEGEEPIRGGYKLQLVTRLSFEETSSEAVKD